MKQYLALAAMAFSVAACGKAGGTAVAAAAASPEAGAAQVAARVGGRAFSNADLDARLKDDMGALRTRAAAAEAQLKAQMDDIHRQIKEQEFSLRKKALTEVLFDMEAAARGISRNELVTQEVSSKAAKVSPQEIDALWESVKSGARGSTKEQLEGQLRTMVMQRKTESELARYQRELFRKYQVALVGLQPQRETVVIPDDAPTLGPKDAPITLVEFTDYQCPYCQQAQQHVDRVMARYGDKVRLVYQEFPLDFHGQAKPAGVAARCAGEQGKFWEMHSNLLLAPGSFDDADLKRRVSALGIDGVKFAACTTSGRYDSVIQKAIENGRSVGVTGTPTFLLNGRSFSGAQPFEVFERMIEEELDMAASKSAGR